MQRRIVSVVALVCMLGAIAAPSAFAESEYFYKNNWLGSPGAVSGAPRGTLYFVGAYTSSGKYYCVGDTNSNGVTFAHWQCTAASSNVISFPADPWYRGWLQLPAGEGGGYFTAEERW